MTNYLDEEDGLTESDRISNSIQSGHNVDPSRGVTEESFLAQYGSGNDAVQPIDEQSFLKMYGGPSAASQGGMTEQDFLAMYGSPNDAPAPQVDPKDDADALAAKSQFIMEEADEDSDTYRDAKAMKEWLGANKDKFNSFSPERKAKIADGINMDYDDAEKQRGHARVFWDAVQRGFWGTGKMIYQGWENLTGDGSEESKQKIRDSVRQGELDDILNPQRIGSTSNIHNVGDALDWFTESIGENATRGAVATGAAALGTLAVPVAPVAGAIVFGTAGTMAMNTGEAVQDQIAEEEMSGGKQKYSRGYANLQGLGYSLLDGAFGASAWAGKLWGNVLKKMGKDVASNELRDAAVRAGLGSAAKELVVKGVLGEGLQEAAQSQLVGRGRRFLQSGSFLRTGEDTSDALLEAWDEFAGGAAAGIGMGGPAAVAGHVRAKNYYRNVTGVQDLEAYGDKFQKMSEQINATRQTLAGDSTFGKFLNFINDDGADGRYAQLLIARHVINDHLKDSNVISDKEREAFEKSNVIIDDEIDELRNSNNPTEKALGDMVRTYVDIFNTTYAKEGFNSTVDEAQRMGMQTEFGKGGLQESVEANDDGSNNVVLKDANTGISVINRIGTDGKSNGWTVVNAPDMKQPMLNDDQLVFATQEEAMEMAAKMDLFNRRRVDKNAAKVQVIRQVFDRLYGQRGAKLEIEDRSTPDGTTAATVVDSKTGGITVKVNVDGINSIGELYNSLVHERAHEDIAELIIQSNNLIGKDGKWVPDGYKRFNEIRDQLMSRVVGAEEALAAAQAVAKKTGKENTWTKRTEEDKKLGRTNKGYVGEELLAERQAITDVVDALKRGNEGLIGTITERIQSAIRGRMAADLGMSPNVIMPADVAKVVGVAFKRNYAGIKGNAAITAETEKTEDTTPTPVKAVNQRPPISNGEGKTFAPGSIIKRDSDNSIFTRTEDGMWRNDQGEESSIVDDATATAGGFTIISEPAAENGVKVGGDGSINVTGNPATETAPESAPEEPVVDPTPEVKTEEPVENAETPVEKPAPAPVEEKAEENPAPVEQAQKTEEPKVEEKKEEPVPEKPANEQKGNLGLTEKVARKKNGKKNSSGNTKSKGKQKDTSASEPQVKNGELTGITTPTKGEKKTEPKVKDGKLTGVVSEERPRPNVEKAAKVETIEVKEEVEKPKAVRIGENLKVYLGIAEKASKINSTQQQKEAAQVYANEHGIGNIHNKPGVMIISKEGALRGILMVAAGDSGEIALIAKDGRMFTDLDECVSEMSDGSVSNRELLGLDGERDADAESFRQIIRGLSRMPRGMELQGHTIPEIKSIINRGFSGITDNALLAKAAKNDDLSRRSFFILSLSKLIDDCRKAGISDEEINEQLTREDGDNFKTKLHDILANVYSDNEEVIRNSKAIYKRNLEMKDSPRGKKERLDALRSKVYDLLWDAVLDSADFPGARPGMSGIGTYVGYDEGDSGRHSKLFTKSWRWDDKKKQLVCKKVPVRAFPPKLMVSSKLLHEYAKAKYAKELEARDIEINERVMSIMEDEKVVNDIISQLTSENKGKDPDFNLLGTKIPAESLLAELSARIIGDYKDRKGSVRRSVEDIGNQTEMFDLLRGDQEVEPEGNASNDIPSAYGTKSGAELVELACDDKNPDMNARYELVRRYCYGGSINVDKKASDSEKDYNRRDSLYGYILSKGVASRDIPDVLSVVRDAMLRSFVIDRDKWNKCLTAENPEDAIEEVAKNMAYSAARESIKYKSMHWLSGFADFYGKQIYGEVVKPKNSGKADEKKGIEETKIEDENANKDVPELGSIDNLKSRNLDSDVDNWDVDAPGINKGVDAYDEYRRTEEKKYVESLKNRLDFIIKRMDASKRTVMYAMMQAFRERELQIKDALWAYYNARITKKQAEAWGIEYIRGTRDAGRIEKKLPNISPFDKSVIIRGAELAGMYPGMFEAALRNTLADLRVLKNAEDTMTIGGSIALAGLKKGIDRDYSGLGVINAIKTINQSHPDSHHLIPVRTIELAESEGLSNDEIAKRMHVAVNSVENHLAIAKRNFGWIDPRVGKDLDSRANFVKGLYAFFEKARAKDPDAEVRRWLKSNGWAFNLEKGEELVGVRNRIEKAKLVDSIIDLVGPEDGIDGARDYLEKQGLSKSDIEKYVEAYNRYDEDVKIRAKYNRQDLMYAYTRVLAREMKKQNAKADAAEARENRIRMNSMLDNIVAEAGAGVNPEAAIRNRLSELGFAEEEIATHLGAWKDKEQRASDKAERKAQKEAEAKQIAKNKSERLKKQMRQEGIEQEIRTQQLGQMTKDEVLDAAREVFSENDKAKEKMSAEDVVQKAREKVAGIFRAQGHQQKTAGELAKDIVTNVLQEREAAAAEARKAEEAAKDRAYLDSLSEEERAKVLAERAVKAKADAEEAVFVNSLPREERKEYYGASPEERAGIRAKKAKENAELVARRAAEDEDRKRYARNKINAEEREKKHLKYMKDAVAKGNYNDVEEAKEKARKQGLTLEAYMNKTWGDDSLRMMADHDLYEKYVVNWKDPTKSEGSTSASHSQPGLFKETDTGYSAAARANREAHGGTITSASLNLNSNDAELQRRATKILDDPAKMDTLVRNAKRNQALRPEEAMALSKGLARLRATRMNLVADETMVHGEELAKYDLDIGNYEEAIARVGYIYGAGLRSFRIGYDLSNVEEHIAYLVQDLKSAMRGAGIGMGKVNDPGAISDPEERRKYERIKKEYEQAKEEIRDYANKVAELNRQLEEAHEAKRKAEEKTTNANSAAELDRIREEARESGYASGLAEAARPPQFSDEEKAAMASEFGFDIDDDLLIGLKYAFNYVGASFESEFGHGAESGAGMVGKRGLNQDLCLVFSNLTKKANGDYEKAIKAFKGNKELESLYREFVSLKKKNAKGKVNVGTGSSGTKQEREERAVKNEIEQESNDFKKKVEHGKRKFKTAQEKLNGKLDRLSDILYRVLENGTEEYKATLGEYARTFARRYFLNNPDATNEEVLKAVCMEMEYQDKTRVYTIEDATKAMDGTDGYRYRTKQSIAVTKAKICKARKALEEGKGLREVAKELGIDYSTDADIIDSVVESLEKMLTAQVNAVDKTIGDTERFKEIGENIERITEALHRIKTSSDKMESVREYVELAGLAKKYRKDMTEAERLKSRLDEWERRIAEEDFETHSKKRVEPKDLAENVVIRRLNMQIRQAQKNYANALRLHRWKKMGVLGKTWTDMLDLLSMVKGIAGSLDFSSFLRQGGQMTWAHPLMAIKSFRNMLGVIKTQEQADNAMIDIMCRDTYPLMERAGIQWTEYGAGKVNYDDRFIPLRGYAWFTKLKPVQGAVSWSERAFAMYLNIMRANMFDYLVAHAQKEFTENGVTEWTDEELMKIGNMINTASQRAAVDDRDVVLKKCIEGANYFLWSPRNFISRIQFLKESAKLLLSYIPKVGDKINFYGPGSRDEKIESITRNLIAKELARYVAGVTGAIIFTKMFRDLFRGDDEPPEDMVLDPRSSDFLKIKFGNTRVDFLSGLQQILVFSMRMTTGEKTNLRGQTHKIQSRYDLAGRFLRSKFSPLGGLVWDLWGGETYDRQDIVYDPRKALVNNKEEISFYRYLLESTMTPLTVRDFVEQCKYTGIGTTIGTFMLTALGAGVQAFDPYSYKQLKEDFNYFKRLRDETSDPVERQRIEEYHPMLKRAGSIEDQIKNIQRIEKGIRRIEKSGGKPGEWMLDNLERERKRAINLMAGFRNPFDVGE